MMRDILGCSRSRNAQTLVFFAVVCLSILLLCGLAIDSGVLYLGKARMSRAVDGAALAAVGNFHRSDIAITNRDQVATIMRNFAVANYTDLGSISTSGSVTPGGTQSSYTTTSGQTAYTYAYNFNDGTQDANGQYKRFVQVTLTTGAGGSITSATCNARCPVHTYFIGFAGSFFKDLKVSSSAVATRNPRLIMVVVDRSASMLKLGGGAFGLPPAIVLFLDFFDTSSDNIGIVSFGSSARLEMPLTTNFIVAGTNNLIDAYQANGTGDGNGEPAPDPEQNSAKSVFDINYATTGVRRLKFGGNTAADEGIRMGMEQLMANAGFNDPDTLKYLVIFTDGQWNQTRTLLAAPGYSNIVSCPYPGPNIGFLTNEVANGMANGQYVGGPQNGGPWSTNMVDNTNLVPVPTLSPYADITNAIPKIFPPSGLFSDLAADHLNDTWLSADGQDEPLGTHQTVVGGIGGVYATNAGVITTDTLVAHDTTPGSSTNFYTHNIDVWLQPGSVDYVYSTNVVTQTYVSDYTKPTKHINIKLASGESNMLVVPGYVTDGLFLDNLDLALGDDGSGDYPVYKINNFNEKYMWPDETSDPDPNIVDDFGYQSNSLMRQLMFRNYANLLTGIYVFRPDEPLEVYTPAHSNVNSQGVEPLIKDYSAYPNGYPRALYGVGPYYPSAGFYWPFGDLELSTSDPNYGVVGIDPFETYSSQDATVELPGNAHKLAFSINMLSTNAAPEWAGEWFYKGAVGGTTNITSDVTTVSTVMSSKADWQVGAPGWIISQFDQPGENIMISDTTHNTNITPNPVVWRPNAFNGSNGPSSGFSFSTAQIKPNDSGNYTHGYVTDGQGNYYRNTMAWSGRPTHYFDFSQGKWISVGSNHKPGTQGLQLCYWKAWEYCWHARAMGVTIFTVGYGSHVDDNQQVFLAKIANATNTTGFATGGTNNPISYNASQPIGQQFQATTTNEIFLDFQSIGQAINSSLTQ